MKSTPPGSPYPSLERYLAQVPGGLDAYPQCQTKAAVVRSILEEFSLTNLDALPPRVADVVRNPPPATGWIPEVVFRCMTRAIFDTHFETPQEYFEWSYHSQRKLLDGPLYRILFFMVSPERVAKQASSRWERFHRGMRLDAAVSDGSLRGTLTYPPHLVEAFDHRTSMSGFRAGLMLAGATDVHAALEDVTATRAVLTFRWR